MSKRKIKYKFTAVIFVTIIFCFALGMVFNVFDVGRDFFAYYNSISRPKEASIEKMKDAICSFEYATNDNIICKMDFIEFYGLTQRIMNKKIVTDYNYGALYKTVYDQITFTVYHKDLNNAINNTTALADGLKKSEIPFLYVQAPYKLPPQISGIENIKIHQLPPNINEYGNSNADNFIEALNNRGIKTYDMRPDFWRSGMSQNELFFNTDHHWNIDGAFLATTLLENYLNSNCGFNIDPEYYDKNNYNRKTYKKFFVGSMGRRVGITYGGVDDFTLITPKFKTRYTVYEKENELTKTYNGDFNNAILVKKYIDPKADISEDRYAVYHGDNAELIFKNHFVDSGKILIIKDSFGIPVYSFLSTGVSEIRALDMRLFKGDVLDYALRYKPDIVILMYNVDTFSDIMFDFK